MNKSSSSLIFCLIFHPIYVITENETWCFQYDQEAKRQIIRRKKPKIDQVQKKTRISNYKSEPWLIRIMLICFVFSITTALFTLNFFKQRQTVYQYCYLDVLTRLRDAADKKRSEFWPISYDGLTFSAKRNKQIAKLVYLLYSGCQMCENVERVRQLVRPDRWLSTRIIAEDFNLNRETRETVRKVLGKN